MIERKVNSFFGTKKVSRMFGQPIEKILLRLPLIKIYSIILPLIFFMDQWIFQITFMNFYLLFLFLLI